MLIDTFEFLSEKARGLLITLGGTGIGTLPEVVEKSSNVVNQDAITTLQSMQLLAYIASFIVAVLTIISYSYKFVLFVRKHYKSSKKD